MTEDSPEHDFQPTSLRVSNAMCSCDEFPCKSSSDSVGRAPHGVGGELTAGFFVVRYASRVHDVSPPSLPPTYVMQMTLHFSSAIVTRFGNSSNVDCNEGPPYGMSAFAHEGEEEGQEILQFADMQYIDFEVKNPKCLLTSCMGVPDANQRTKKPHLSLSRLPCVTGFAVLLYQAITSCICT